MDLATLLAIEDIGQRIEALKKGRKRPLPDIATYRKQWDVEQHETVTNKTMLPSRLVEGEDGNQKLEEVNRAAFPFQKRIVNTAVAFAFGNAVKLNCTPEGAEQKMIYQALLKIGPDAKLDSLTRGIYRELLRATECAELWYYNAKPNTHNLYGFPTKLKVRCELLSPFAGDVLYPYFDATGDMIAFSREFVRHSDDKTVSFFETYTDTQKFIWIKEDGNWREYAPAVTHSIGKIPVCYATQEAVEWYDVQRSIQRVEMLLSRYGEINDYNASPAIFINGQVDNLPSKGAATKVFQSSDPNANMKVVSWDKAPEAVKLELDTLIKFIYSMTQTPDLSLENVKGISNISGVALKLLFMDAHLKVQEKREILDDYLQRRVNIQKQMVAKLDNKETAADEMSVIPEIVPYIIDDESTAIKNLVEATAGKQIMSQKTAIQYLGWVDDAEAELKTIQEEEKASQSFNVFEPTNS